MNHPVLHSTHDVIARMADEGLPVCAIARALKMPSDDVREILQDALAGGVIIEYPREDWPPSSNRSNRGPKMDTTLLDDEEKLHIACARYFGTTRQQSTVLGMLLKRSEVTKEQLHQTIERDRPSAIEQTNIKLVDVLVCILRRKLKKFALKWHGDEDYQLIRTMWGRGYLMDAKDRARAIHELTDFARKANDPGELTLDEEQAA